MNNPQAERPDFELTKYELDRAHELELNKFAHALEIERLKILQLVNGGAFTVLVAFASDLLRVGGDARGYALAAAGCWVFGLTTAAVATQIQVKQQARFNQSVRYRRNATEWRRLDERYPQVADMVGPPGSKKNPPISAESYDLLARKTYYKGKAIGSWVTYWAMASVGLFVLGAALLTLSISLADPAPSPPAVQGRR